MTPRTPNKILDILRLTIIRLQHFDKGQTHRSDIYYNSMDTKMIFFVALISTFVLIQNCSALSTNCTDNANCTDVHANSLCNTTAITDGNGDGECECASAYKENGDDCIAKGLGDPCSSHGDCADVTNANCNTTNCVCEGQYKIDDTSCVAKALGDPCSSNGDCANVTNANCNTTNCVCEGQYKIDGTSCVAKVLDDACSAGSDCAGISNAQCLSSLCKCKTGYVNSDATTCSIVLGDTCSHDTNCTDHVTNAECSGSPMKCTCKTNYNQMEAICELDGVEVVGGSVILLTTSVTTVLLWQQLK